MSLHPCASCGRHVRNTEAACPFCAAALAPTASAPERPMPTVRLSRAATFAFGAIVATSASACSGPVGPLDAGCCDAAYGAPPFDGGELIDGGAPVDAGGTTDGGLAGAYGGPPVDAGQAEGGPGNLYGAPPP